MGGGGKYSYRPCNRNFTIVGGGKGGGGAEHEQGKQGRNWTQLAKRWQAANMKLTNTVQCIYIIIVTCFLLAGKAVEKGVCVLRLEHDIK